MKNQRGIVLFLTAVFAGAMFGVASAQPAAPAAPAAPPQAIRTAVVDMVVLLRSHPKLNADMKDFNTQRQAIATQLMNAENTLREEARVLMGSYKPGTDEFNQANEAFEKKMAEHNANKNKAQRELMMKDMKIKYEAFKSIRDEIQNFSVPRGVAVVVDVRGTDPEADELTNAEAEVGQTVVWNAAGVNMTAQIVQMLNQKFSQYPAAAKIENGRVVFLNTGAADGMSAGPQIPSRPAAGTQPVAAPGTVPAGAPRR